LVVVEGTHRQKVAVEDFLVMQRLDSNFLAGLADTAQLVVQ
jgi:hypothetical protein